MSAEGAVHAAFVAALRGAAEVGGAVNHVFEGPAVKASAPYAEVQAGPVVDWSTKDRAGRELRPAVALYDAGESPARRARRSRRCRAISTAGGSPASRSAARGCCG